MENETVTAALDNLKQIFICTVCTNLLITPTQIQCGHIFCAPCINTIQTSKPAKCPICNAKISRRALSVRNDVDNLLQSVVFNFIPAVIAENDKGNNNTMAPSTWSTGINLNDSSSSSSSSDSDSDRGPPPLKKIFRNRSKDLVKKKAKELTTKAKEVKKTHEQQENTKKSHELDNATTSQEQDNAKVNVSQEKGNVNRVQEQDNVNRVQQQDNVKSLLKTAQENDGTKKVQEHENAKMLEKVQENDGTKMVQERDNVQMVNKIQEMDTIETVDSVERVQRKEKDVQKVAMNVSLNSGGGSFRIRCRKPEPILFPHRPASPDQPMDLSINGRDRNLNNPRERHYRSALVYIRPLDLSINKELTKALETSTACPAICNSQAANSNEPSVSNVVGVISNDESTTSSTVLISNHDHESSSSKTDGIVSNDDPARDSGLLFPEPVIPYPEALITHFEPEVVDPNPESVISNMESENEFIQLVKQMEVDVSPIKPVNPTKKSTGSGLYLNLTSTPVSTRSIENGRLDDSVADLFMDYLSQENRIVANNATEKNVEVEIPDNDSVFSEDEIPASPLIPGTSFRIPVSTPRTPRKFVFCPTRLTKLQLSKLNQLCRMCSGTIVNEYSDDVTHLIINLENDRVPQTMKYLFAIADKKWIVTYDWVEECITKDKVVNEEPYETSSFPQCDSGVRKSRVSSGLLYEGIHFYFASVLKSSGASIEDCKKLLAKLGGTSIDSPYAADRNVMIIGDPLIMTNSYQEWYKTKGYITVSWEWILDCLLSFSVLPFNKSHLITKLDSAGLSQACLPDAILSANKLNSEH